MADTEQTTEQAQAEGKRNVLIAMDGSKHAVYAFECE